MLEATNMKIWCSKNIFVKLFIQVPEDQDVGSKVIEVRAKDLDTEASITTYSIVSGDPGKAFSIEEQTGFIRVAKPLDYEGKLSIF